MAGSGFSYYATSVADTSNLGRLIPNIIEVDSGQTSNVANPVSIADGRGYFVALPNYYHKVRYAFNTFSNWISWILSNSLEISCIPSVKIFAIR